MAYDVLVHPSKLQGHVRVPPSKSLLHRALISALLSRGVSVIFPFVESDDILATLNVLKAFGASWKIKDDRLRVKGVGRPRPPKRPIEVKASASSLRFAIPLAMLTGSEVTFLMDESLANRPLDPYVALFPNSLEKNGPRLVVRPRLTGGDIVLDGSFGSQFASGLLFALPFLDETSTLHIKNPTSRPYIDLTVDTLENAGIRIIKQNDAFRIPPAQDFRPREIFIEGDYSLASLFLVAGLRSTGVEVHPLVSDSLQADRNIIETIRNAGGKIIHTEDGYRSSSSRTSAFITEVEDNPDLIFALALLASLSEGESIIHHTERLRFKESDRIKSIFELLKKLHVDIVVEEDFLRVRGPVSRFSGASIDSHDDHRLVMLAAIAGTMASGPVHILHAEAVHKSYPAFFQDLGALGANLSIVKRRDIA